MSISSKRPMKNRTEWRSGFVRVFTSLAADIDFFATGPQTSSNNVLPAELHFLATTAGILVLTGPDGVDVPLPVALGWNVYPAEWRKFEFTGTTAVGTIVLYW